MNYWSLAFALMIFTAAIAGKYLNPSDGLAGATTPSGKPVTALVTPVTP